MPSICWCRKATDSGSRVRRPCSTWTRCVHMARSASSSKEAAMEGYEKLGYMALNVSDVGRSKEFYEKQVGLQVSGEADGIAFLRCTEDHHNIALYASDMPGLKRAGFEMKSAKALDDLGARLAGQGIAVVEVPAAERKLLGLGRAFRITEPSTGATYEFYDHMRQFGGQPFRPTVAKIQRLG